MFKTPAEVDDGWSKLEWFLFMTSTAYAALSPSLFVPARLYHLLHDVFKCRSTVYHSLCLSCGTLLEEVNER